MLAPLTALALALAGQTGHPPALPAAPEPAEDAGGLSPHARSVYALHPVDLPLTALSLAGSILPNQFPTRIIRQRCPCDPAEVARLDRVAIGLHSRAADVASDVTVGLAVAGPVLADLLWVGWSPAFREDAAILTETLAVNAVLVVGVKYLTQRPLPVTYENRDGLARQAQGYRAFYSGHTSTAFAALTAAAWTFTLREGPAAWPWWVVGVAGASVGVERVLAGRHFPSDVLVGAAAGLVVGTAVPLLHARRPPGRGGITMTPAPGGAAIAVRF